MTRTFYWLVFSVWQVAVSSTHIPVYVPRGDHNIPRGDLSVSKEDLSIPKWDHNHTDQSKSKDGDKQTLLIHPNTNENFSDKETNSVMHRENDLDILSSVDSDYRSDNYGSIEQNDDYESDVYGPFQQNSDYANDVYGQHNYDAVRDLNHHKSEKDGTDYVDLYLSPKSNDKYTWKDDEQAGKYNSENAYTNSGYFNPLDNVPNHNQINEHRDFYDNDNDNEFVDKNSQTSYPKNKKGPHSFIQDFTSDNGSYEELSNKNNVNENSERNNDESPLIHKFNDYDESHNYFPTDESHQNFDDNTNYENPSPPSNNYRNYQEHQEFVQKGSYVIGKYNNGYKSSEKYPQYIDKHSKTVGTNNFDSAKYDQDGQYFIDNKSPDQASDFIIDDHRNHEESHYSADHINNDETLHHINNHRNTDYEKPEHSITHDNQNNLDTIHSINIDKDSNQQFINFNHPEDHYEGNNEEFENSELFSGFNNFEDQVEGRNNEFFFDEKSVYNDGVRDPNYNVDGGKYTDTIPDGNLVDHIEFVTNNNSHISDATQDHGDHIEPRYKDHGEKFGHLELGHEDLARNGPQDNEKNIIQLGHGSQDHEEHGHEYDHSGKQEYDDQGQHIGHKYEHLGDHTNNGQNIGNRYEDRGGHIGRGYEEHGGHIRHGYEDHGDHIGHGYENHEENIGHGYEDHEENIGHGYEEDSDNHVPEDRGGHGGYEGETGHGHGYDHDRSGYGEHGYESDASYSYAYAVNGGSYGPTFNHHENRFGYNTKGSYSVQLPDGRTQTVSYRVPDKYTGYIANVKYEGKAIHPPKHGRHYA